MTAQLQGRELDAALAKALGEQVEWCDVYWFAGHQEWIFDIAGINPGELERQPVTAGTEMVLPFFSTDLDAMHSVEDELMRRDKYHEYIDALDGIVLGGWYTRHPEHEMTHATAEQKARAALAVLTEAK